MVNKKDKSILEELIKETLINYEVPSISTDWAQMEQILDTAPKSNSYKYKLRLLSVYDSITDIPKSKSAKWLFSPYFLIPLVLIVGAYFLYTILNSPKTNIEATTQNTTTTTNWADSITKTDSANSFQENWNALTNVEQHNDSIDNTLPKELTQLVDTVKKDALIPNAADEIKKTEILPAENVKADSLINPVKKETIISKQNIPNVKSDSSAIKNGELKEKAATNLIKEESKDPSVIQLGQNNLILYNSDSLKINQKEQTPDSTKGPN